MRLLGLHAKTPAGYSPNVLGPTNNALRLNPSPSLFILLHSHPGGEEGRAGSSPVLWKGHTSQGNQDSAFALLCGLGQLYLLLWSSESSSPRDKTVKNEMQPPLLPGQQNHLGSFYQMQVFSTPPGVHFS